MEQVTSAAVFPPQTAQPSGHLTGASAIKTYPAATAVHFEASAQAVQPFEVVHYLHYFEVASKYHPTLQVAQAFLVAAHAVQPLVPSTHL